MATGTHMTSPPAARLRAPGRGSIAILLGAILALAAGLRLLGVTFGLPAVYNPDEVAIMARSLAFAKGDLNPHNFLYPTFYFYVLFAWLGASFVVMWLTGVVSSLSAFQAMFFTDPSPIYLAGRLLGVACGVATVGAAHALGRRTASFRTPGVTSATGSTGAGAPAGAMDAVQAASWIGLTAALFLAVAPSHVRDSHYVKHDVPVTLAVVIAQLAILRLVATSSATRRDLLLAAAACGLAFSTHYYAVFLALPLALAIVLRSFQTMRPGQMWRLGADVLWPLVLAAAVTAIVFFALSPFLLLEPRTAWQDIVANRQIVVDRAVDARHGAFASAGAYLRMLWDEAIGWPVALAAAAGLAILVREQWRSALLLIAFPVAFLGFISNTVSASRYLNPVLPTLCVLAAIGVWRGGQLALGARWRPWIGAILALLCALPGFGLSLRLGLFFRQADTRTVAQRFIEQQVPAGSTVLLQPYSVPLAQSRDSLREALAVHLGDASRASTKFALRLAAEPYPSPAYRTLFLGDGGLDPDKIYLSYRDLTEAGAGSVLAAAGVQFVVLKQYNVPDPAVAPLRAWLARHGRGLAVFTPYRAEADAQARARVAPFLHNTDTPYDPALERPGPGVEVWRID
jgi:hypothetical protein